MVSAILGPRAHLKHYDLWVYNLIRIFSYAALGIVLGYLSETLNIFLKGSGQILAYGAGGLLVALGLLRLVNISSPISFAKLYRVVGGSAVLTGKTFIPKSVGLGIMTAFLPCMTLSPALLLAAGSLNPITGGVAMLGFGLGTLPVMMIAPGTAGFILTKIPKRFASIIANLFLIIGGLITIARA